MRDFKTQGDVFNDWPNVGEILYDKRIGNRQLEVKEVRPKDDLGRNIIGTLNDSTFTYSCDINTLCAVWCRK